jgi:hypothetical protein
MGTIFLMGTSAAALMRALPAVPPPVESAYVPFVYVNFSDYVGATEANDESMTSRGSSLGSFVNTGGITIGTASPPSGVAKYGSLTVALTGEMIMTTDDLRDRLPVTGPFMLEAYYKHDAGNTTHSIFGELISTYNDYRWRLDYVGSGSGVDDYVRLRMRPLYLGAPVEIQSSVFATGWHHFAISRDADGLVRLFVDGVLAGSASIPSIEDTFVTGMNFKIGSNTGGNGGLLGMALIRYDRENAIYEADFTPPTDATFAAFGAADGDPFLADVIAGWTGQAIRSNMGTKAHYGFLTANIISGNSIVSSDVQVRAGHGRWSMLTSSDFAAPSTLGYQPEMSHAGKSITLDYWFYIATARSNEVMAGGIGRWQTSGQFSYFMGIEVIGGVNRLKFRYSTTGANTVEFTSTTILDINVWNHLAVCYDQPTQTLRMFINGVMELKVETVPEFYDGGTSNMYFGSDNSSADCYGNSHTHDGRITFASRYNDDAGFTPGPARTYPQVL